MEIAKSEERTSKTLSWLLRHGALKEGLNIEADGFVTVAAILQHPRYASVFTLEKLQHIVATDKKNRFTLRTRNGVHEIRANQGHSMAAVQSDQCLTHIKDAAEVPLAVHGTYYRHWERIRQEGLRRMGRNHIHFAVSDVVQNTKETIISGFRSNCQILIYLDVIKAMNSGMKIYRSENNVILCAGLANGEIPVEYFSKVVDRRTGRVLII